MNKALKLLLSILITQGVGLVSVPVTISSIPTWYATLNKPVFSPPNWIFGPVWTILYLLMGISMYLVWTSSSNKRKVKTALIYFFIQLLFNFLWSYLFFGLHSPLLAFIDIVLLWFAILVTTLNFYRISKTSSYLLIPYFIWVSFASILNFSILILNST